MTNDLLSKEDLVTEEFTLFELPDEGKKSKAPQEEAVNLLTVAETFELWIEVHGKRNPVLTPDRQRIITKAIKTFGKEMVENAIRGCALSDWHMGKNPGGKKYNDISLILRNAEKIEGFAETYLNSQTGGGFLD